ncbi:MAG: zf-HC2 domain-containing protein [Marinilabiliaceae bacterium]|jgi:predicted anti-sigma-YlaC factor YlaD|nr:zf-HC2 domain-containing protein [Marinilabiliaceae bacterium]
MNCFNESSLQEYFDNEVPPEDQQIIEKHLEACDKCRSMLEKVAKESSLIKEALVPGMGIEIKLKPKASRTLLNGWSWISIAASVAALILLIFLLQADKTDINEIRAVEMRIMEHYDGADPNRAWHNNEPSILFDEKNGDLFFSL